MTCIRCLPLPAAKISHLLGEESPNLPASTRSVLSRGIHRRQLDSLEELITDLMV